MAAAPVVYFQIATCDPARTQAFLQDLFGWDIQAGGAPPIVANIDPGGPADFDAKGSLMQLPPGAPPFVSLFVRVDDLNAAFARAQQLGASVVVPVVEIPGPTHIAIIRSPDGLTFGIVQA